MIGAEQLDQPCIPVCEQLKVEGIKARVISMPSWEVFESQGQEYRDSVPPPEITARLGRDPGEIYRELAREFGEPVYHRVEAPATPEQKQMLAQLSPQRILSADLAGEKVETILTHAPGNNAPIGGLKVITKSGWFAARASGTEDIYKIYAESFRGADHLRRILAEAQVIVAAAPAAPPCSEGIASGKNLKERP